MTKASTLKKAIAAIEALEQDQNTERERLNSEMADAKDKIDAIHAKFKEFRTEQDRLEKSLVGGERDRIKSCRSQLEGLDGEDLPMDGHNSSKADKGMEATDDSSKAEKAV